MGDVECRACAAGLPIVWDVQRRRNMHLAPGLSTETCARLDAREQRAKEQRGIPVIDVTAEGAAPLMKRCPDCERDPDPRGPSACFYCRELNRVDVPSPRIPWHVAGLYRAVNDYAAALRCGHPDIDVLKIALDGAVAGYSKAERLGEGE